MEFIIICVLCGVAFFCGMQVGENTEKVKRMNDKLQTWKPNDK